MNTDDMTQREQLALISTATAPPLSDAITTWRDTAKWAWDTADQIERRLQRLTDPHEGWTGSGAEAFAKVVRTELIDNLRSYARQAGGHTASGMQHSGYDAKLRPVLDAVKGSHTTATKNNVPWDVDPQWQADIPPKPDDDDKPKPGEAAKPAEPVKVRNGHGGVVTEVDKDRWKALLQANPQTAVPAIYGTAGIAVSPQTHRADRLFEALHLNTGPKAEVHRAVQAVLTSLDTFAPEKVKAASTTGKNYAQGATGGAGGAGGGGGAGGTGGGYPGGTGGTGYPGGTGHTGDPGPYPGGGGPGHTGDPYPGGGGPGDPAPYPGGGGPGHPGDPAPYPGGGGSGDPAPYPPGTPVHTGPTAPTDPGSGYGGYHHGTVGAGAGAGGIGGAGVPAGGGVGAGAAGGTVGVGSPGASGLGSFGGVAGAPGTSFATGPDGRASVNPGNVGRLGGVGAGAGGAGSGGTGGVAPMPRRSAGSDEDEERTEVDGTWLEEDDSVWGNRAGAPPAEIR